MKTFTRSILCSVAASLVALSAGQAEAQSAGSLLAELTRFDIDPQLEYLQDVDAGTIVVDPSAREIVLTLRHPARSTQPLEPEVIRLPLVSTTQGTCNTTYVARRDGRIYDGPLETLTVIDYYNVQTATTPRRPCPRPAAPTFIAYDIVTSGFGSPVREMHSEFSAGVLTRGL
ncbi:hypothetical protein [Polyangium aurulentum]|uniref:hypothetical protein n=1 Tax=Polyangium aurulentum TaxID=2567896 RepID=UPI0010ADADE0|nr:hypothetical protein [Polyangium aurulentum]UQA57249.1 hypothetical protein E8A73_039080 [Polyangium aurulentum]